jgi:CBS domain-containing protein
MTRREGHFDAMLRHLGATYYQTVRGGATASDVARALESVEAEDGRGHELASSRRPGKSGRWRVSDVMTTDVVTADKTASYKQAAQIMAGHKVSAVPVLTKNGHVAGIVSEADVLRKEERDFGRLGTGLPRHTRRERAQADARTVTELMTTPVITIHPDAPVGAAARLMNGHRIRRLPVVDSSGKLIGIVSRRDLLSVFLRPDEEIAAEVHGMLTGILLAEPDGVTVQVRDGVVTLAGTLAREELIEAAQRLASGVDGVITVVCKLTAAPAATDAPSARACNSAGDAHAPVVTSVRGCARIRWMRTAPSGVTGRIAPDRRSRKTPTCS